MKKSLEYLKKKNPGDTVQLVQPPSVDGAPDIGRCSVLDLRIDLEPNQSVVTSGRGGRGRWVFWESPDRLQPLMGHAAGVRLQHHPGCAVSCLLLN